MITLEIWGDYASFTRPEYKVERYSYDFITPSAARNILQAIYWNPTFDWVIDKIYVMNPIKRMRITRNEMKDKGSYKEMQEAAISGKRAPHLNIRQTQRNAVVLKDVRYVIQAHFEGKENSAFDIEMAHNIFEKRTSIGQCFSTPYLGCREFPAHYRVLSNDEEIKPINLTKEYGLMLYDIDYSGETKKPMFFNARMENGVIDVKNSEVYRQC